MLRGVFRDITESKEISEKAFFQARLLNSVRQAIIATDVKGNISYWNSAADKLYGWKKAEVIGCSVIDILMDETYKVQALEVFQRLTAGEQWSGSFLLNVVMAQFSQLS